jgi:hypothetical protein
MFRLLRSRTFLMGSCFDVQVNMGSSGQASCATVCRSKNFRREFPSLSKRRAVFALDTRQMKTAQERALLGVPSL